MSLACRHLTWVPFRWLCTTKAFTNSMQAFSKTWTLTGKSVNGLPVGAKATPVLPV